jgi:rare lipoprotein A
MRPRRACGRILLGTGVLIGSLALGNCIRKPAALPPGVQTGTASWYGGEFHGRLTSSREVYNMYDLTAAHKTLPFGTRVMVTNLRNGRSVEVRINDRGPFVGDRLIDLSYAAARVLDLVGPGTAPVRLDILADSAPGGPGTTAPRFWVQAGAFTVRDNADNLARSLAAMPGCEGVLLSEFRTSSQVFYRVRVPAGSRAEAERIADRLADAGFRLIILEE